MLYQKANGFRLRQETVQKRIESKGVRVKDDGILPAHAADDLHRRALYWLDRFSKEGIEGLKDKSKTGRPPKIPKELAIKIRREL